MWGGSLEGVVGGHRQRPIRVAIDEHLSRRARGVSQTCEVHQRDEMLWRGRREMEVRVALQGDNRCRWGGHSLARGSIESCGSVVGAVGSAPVDLLKIVQDISAADDQYSSLAKPSELLAELEVVDR